MSHPVRGKHVSFDGRYLHGAPAQLATLTQQQQQQQQKQQQEHTSLPPPPPPPLQQPSSAAIETSPSYVDKHDISNNTSSSSSSSTSDDELVNDEELRVTFLVNIWLNHHPAGIGPLPEEIRSGDPPLSLCYYIPSSITFTRENSRRYHIIPPRFYTDCHAVLNMSSETYYRSTPLMNADVFLPRYSCIYLFIYLSTGRLVYSVTSGGRRRVDTA